jgi:hypothetical protein
MTRLAKAPGKHPAQNKYGAIKTRGYDSAHEAERARELHLLEKAGKIRDLREQVRFELVPAMWQHVDGSIGADWYVVPTPVLHRDVEEAILEGATVIRPVMAPPTSRDALRRMKAKCIQRPTEYRADFVYIDEDGWLVVEDAKGVRTPDYIIKRKLMLWLYGIKIREV